LGVKPRHRVKKGTEVEQWIGISTDEAMRMKHARLTMVNITLAFNRNEDVSYGLFTMVS
jgi:hypothetical protein